MTIFNLPDLGEGLPDAEIHQWYVAEGDTINIDQPLVSMETAKAVVDVPSPFSGRIVTLHGKTGDIIQTGEPLVTFAVDGQTPATTQHHEPTLETTSHTALSAETTTKTAVKAIPAVRALAQKLHVDLAAVTGTGPDGTITADDVQNAANQKPAQQAEGEPLHGARRIMAQQMAKSHAEVVPVTLTEDADLFRWPEKTDVTLRLIRALVAACQAEPIFNSHFFGASNKLYKEINIGIAVDTPHGLYVPVIKDAANQSDQALRNTLNAFKEKAKNQSFAPEELKNATISLSNFGTITGRYSSPIVVPPTVAIVGIGKTRPTVVAHEGQVAIHNLMPIALTFDHRAATGGEAARFLAAFINQLQQA